MTLFSTRFGSSQSYCEVVQMKTFNIQIFIGENLIEAAGVKMPFDINRPTPSSRQMRDDSRKKSGRWAWVTSVQLLRMESEAGA